MNNQVAEILRYAINGLIATAVHYGVLTLNYDLFKFNSAGIANLVASIFGITTSFIGNRYFVFNIITESISTQFKNFLTLYGIIAILNFIIMYLWSDIMGYNYNYGFIIATILQFLFSYFGTKKLVFNL